MNAGKIKADDIIPAGIDNPEDVKRLSINGLKLLADDIRREMIETVSVTGGHLGAGLGVAELTVALHYVFDTPDDKLIWDVGHQSYPHKILTGRRNRMKTLRKGGGLSGFTKRDESVYDPFGAGHSSTSISAAAGMAVARDLSGKKNHVIAVIGDGSMTGGMAYEAMNHAGAEKRNLIVILNDNDMSISRPVGALSSHLSRLVSSRSYRRLRVFGKEASKNFPLVNRCAKKIEGAFRQFIGGETVFEKLGFYYVGPVDGHNLDHLIPILQNLRDTDNYGPVLLHVVTKKGQGYKPAEIAADRLHAVRTFDIITGEQVKSDVGRCSYSSVFGSVLAEAMKNDDKIIAVTAAMPTGTGLDKVAAVYPDRVFDVGIAEQHAVTFATGAACEGFKPFVAIYSSFMQRAYDQIIHDVAIQNLPVRFAIDRAGLVGPDGATHAGTYDTAFLSCVPNMVLMAPSDENELAGAVKTACGYDSGPIAFRFPRADGYKNNISANAKSWEIGKGRIIRNGTDCMILSYGCRLGEIMKAAAELDKAGISVTVADARFAKPLDTDMILSGVKSHKAMITVEEGSSGGFGSSVQKLLIDDGVFDSGFVFRAMTLPDRFIAHDTLEAQYKEAGLDADAIVSVVRSILKKENADELRADIIAVNR